MSNTQTTLNTATTLTGGGQATYLNKTFYDKKLLETARTRLVFAKFGQKRSIPKNMGKRVEFRRYDLFLPESAAAPLQEGITPEGQSLSQSRVEAEVLQYGAYIEISDVLEATSYDEVVSDSAELLGEQLGTVIEWITRDALSSGTNLQYAGGKTARLLISASEKLTVNEIRKAVRTLKKAKARLFTTDEAGKSRKPHFICICSPEATYDLQSDSLWQDVSKYSNAEQIYSGEIGRLFGVVFVESTEAKVFTQSVYASVASHTAGSADVVLAALSLQGEAYLAQSGAKVKIGVTEHTVSSYNAKNSKLTLSAAVSTEIAEGTAVYSEDAGVIDATTKTGLDVHATLVFGADAYGVVDVMQLGCLNTIIKRPGSAGAMDPLDQRGTVGAKVAAYAATILNPLWVVRIEHAVSA